MKPEQAQMFVDAANGEINILAQSNGTKGSGTALTLDSHYIEVTVNKDRSTRISLLNRAVLSSGDVTHVKNVTQLTTLEIGHDYIIGDDAKSVIVDGVYARQSGVMRFSLGNNLNCGTDDFSISGWFRRDGNPGGNAYLAHKFNSASSYWLVWFNTSGVLCSGIVTVAVPATGTDGASVCDNEWHHFAVVWDRSGNMTRYIDGVTYGSATDITSRSASITNADSFYLLATTPGAGLFGGDLCQLRFQVAGTLVTPTQIAYQAAHIRDYSENGWTLDGTRGYWTFEDDAAAANADADGMITDGSGTGNHFDAVGGDTTNYGTHARHAVVDPGDVIEVKYDQYYSVISTGLSEVRAPGPSAGAPGRSVALQLQGMIGID